MLPVSSSTGSAGTPGAEGKVAALIDPPGTTGMPADQRIRDPLPAGPTYDAAVAAVHTGDLTALQQLLTDHPDLVTARPARQQGRTLLHVATDWPGHHPGVAATIHALVAAGADPNAPFLGDHPETPLHWAASSGDLAAIEALLDSGADINAPGAVIAGGTPMADATAFGQWDAARYLLARGADTNLFEASALGLVTRVHEHLAASQPTREHVTSSFWGACHGGQVDTAAVLLEHGADINWKGYDGLTPLDAARRADAPALAEWLEQRGAVAG
jgi:ankyrin repeat protein